MYELETQYVSSLRHNLFLEFYKLHDFRKFFFWNAVGPFWSSLTSTKRLKTSASGEKNCFVLENFVICEHHSWWLWISDFDRSDFDDDDDDDGDGDDDDDDDGGQI